MLEYASLASGSSGNVHYLRSAQRQILIDVGMSATYIKKALASLHRSMGEVNAVFLTHEHHDHVKGLRVLSKSYDFDLYAHENTLEALASELVFMAPERIHVLGEQPIDLGDMHIETFCIPHDASHTFGYKVHVGSERVGVITDVGEVSERLITWLESCQILVVEANHDVRLVESGPYPYPLKRRILGKKGHLSNRDCAELVAELCLRKKGPKICLLAHLSKQNNHPELALMSVESLLRERGVEVGTQILIDLAGRNEISKIYYVETETI